MEENLVSNPRDSEASLRMVVPGVDFVVAPFIGRNVGEDQKKKWSSLQNELVFIPKVCDDQKKRSLHTNQ